MKKFLFLMLSLILCLTCCVSVGCGKKDWKGTIQNWGDVDQSTLGGFMVSTEKYLFYINGIGASGEDNTFGAPVKGSLMAVEKSTLGTDDVKTAIVVPKLFVASDNGAGVYIYGSGEETYVYYGTPCTDKNSSGDIAYNKMTFMRTRLDGGKSDTFITVDALSNEYRIIENNGKVYIIYYDSNETALISYDTATKSKTIIAKTDATTTASVSIDNANYYPSLGEYKFTNDGVVYTATCYDENYFEQKAKQDNYSRSTAKFNILLSYTAGDEKVENFDFYGRIIANGKSESLTYTVNQIVKGTSDTFAFVTATDVNSKATIYGGKITDFDKFDTWETVKSIDKVSATGLIVSLEEYYYVDLDNANIIKTSLTNDIRETTKKVATSSSANSLVALSDGYIYFYNLENKLARFKLPADEQLQNSNEELVSEDTVATTWYAPEIIQIDSKTYIFYCDNSSAGCSYIKYIDLATTVTEEDTDDDGKVDSYYFEGQKFLAQRIDKDIANDAVVAISKISTSELNFVEENGNLVDKDVQNAREVYNALSDDLKKLVSEESYKILLADEQAVELANLYNKLKGVIDYEDMNENEKTEFKTNIQADYDNAKAKNSALRESTEFSYASVRDKLSNNLKYYYQAVDKLFAE